jgi:hypothetical protein
MYFTLRQTYDKIFPCEPAAKFEKIEFSKDHAAIFTETRCFQEKAPEKKFIWKQKISCF